jgi:hypothetical protein
MGQRDTHVALAHFSPILAAPVTLEEPTMQDRPPALPADKVQSFVSVAHGDLAAVQSLLAELPGLINAAWDWGGGDFETGLGAAAHMGRRDIAEFLLTHGARFDLYAAAMLGQLDTVKAILTANPEARHVPGAHGIPLIVHAQQGGAQAQAVLEYLQSLA